REHLVERVSRDRGLPVAGQEATPLMDDAASGGICGWGDGLTSRLWRVKPIEAVPFNAVFPRRDRHVIDDLPEHGVVRAQPVRLPVPPLFRHLEREGRIEEEREHTVVASAPSLGKIRWPDNHDEIWMFMRSEERRVGKECRSRWRRWQ